jgi:hypothetical protein
VEFRDIHGFNRYAYANNNPYKYVDPDGRQSMEVWNPMDEVNMLAIGLGYENKQDANANFANDIKEVTVEGTVMTLDGATTAANYIAAEIGTYATVPSPLSPAFAEAATVLTLVGVTTELISSAITGDGNNGAEHAISNVISVGYGKKAEKLAMKHTEYREVGATIEVLYKKIFQKAYEVGQQDDAQE